MAEPMAPGRVAAVLEAVAGRICHADGLKPSNLSGKLQLAQDNVTDLLELVTELSAELARIRGGEPGGRGGELLRPKVHRQRSTGPPR
jgi:hypothetical protein